MWVVLEGFYDLHFVPSINSHDLASCSIEKRTWKAHNDLMRAAVVGVLDRCTSLMASLASAVPSVP
jgi:hypothetical protein